MVKKILKIVFKTFLTLIVAALLASLFFYSVFKPSKTITWGLTFSSLAAQGLGQDPVTVYNSILEDLKPKTIRLMAYWEQVEPTRGAFDFNQLDYFMQQAAVHGTSVVLVVGHKQPRWPECHEPSWYQSLSQNDKAAATKDMIQTVVSHYKDAPALAVWQVENEPLFPFGPDCVPLTRPALQSEIDLVRSLDTKHSILVTDSGELSSWLPTATAGGNLFGSTMYRQVYDRRVGFVTYPLPPAFYRVKAGMVKTFSNISDIWGVELQAEPWFDSNAQSTPLAVQIQRMNPHILMQNVNYAKAVGLSQNYLWGVEWWYWLKSTHQDSSMWDAAKTIFQTN